MRKIQCVVEFMDDDATTTEQNSRIVDVYARSGEEFIDLEEVKAIRLDRLVRINGKTIGGSCEID